MSGLEVLGAVDASSGLISSAYHFLVQLRENWKNSKDVAEKLDQLSQLAKNIEEVVKNITTKVRSCPENAREFVASGVLDALQGKVEGNVEKAMTELKKLEKYQKSFAGPSSGVGKLRNQLRTSRAGVTAKMNSISEALSEAEQYLDKALQEASSIELHRFHIEIHRKLDSLCLTQPEKECFVPHFDCPNLPDNVVLDFSSSETQEGRLLCKLLELCEKESVHGMSAVGSGRGRGRGSATHGMGGVGKTTALRAICYEAEVREAFPDGICFLEFGQNAKDGDIQDQLERCIRNLGGMTTLAEMKKQTLLKGVVNQAAGWLRQKRMLFVCDDLWQSPTCDFGYLPLLKKLLVDAPRSKLLVSTRDQRIAEEVSTNCETFGTLPFHGLSARNLLGQVAFGDEHVEIMKRPDIQGYIDTILNVCAGLQLALCMAGRALRTERRMLGDIRKAFENYASQVERDRRPDEMGRGAQLYDRGLSYIVEASLIQCERWAEKSLRKVNVHELFRSLCVLEKQLLIPKSLLSNLWRLSPRVTDYVVQKFADVGLITKAMFKISSKANQDETVEDYGVRLHDLILVLCQEMAHDEQEEWHGSVVDTLKQSKSVWIDEEIPTLDEWWRLKNGAYIYGNLSRHMVKCGRKQELAKLLSDARWTLRRIDVGGWLELKMDFDLLLEGSGYAEFKDIGQIYKVVGRHWSEVSRDQRFLSYYIGGSLTAEERKKKYTALYVNSMMRYLSRPFLLPRSKFLGAYDSRELSLLTCLRNPDSMRMDFSRSADNAVLAVGNLMSVWSVRGQKELCYFSSGSQSWKDGLTSVAISPNGRLIFSGHRDGSVRRWDAESGEPVGVWVGLHSDSVTCLAIGRDGSTFVSGSYDKTCRLWNAKNGKPKGSPMHHLAAVACVAISESGSLIVSGSGSIVRRWSTETSAMIGEPMFGHQFNVSCVTVDDNGEKVVSGSTDKTLLRWDAKTGKQIGKPMCGHSGFIESVTISSCGKMIVSGSRDNTLQMWDMASGKPIGEPFRGHLNVVRFVRFTEENGVIVSGSSDGTIRRWRTVPNTRISESIQRCEGRVRRIMFCNDGQKVVTKCTKRALLQWDANTGEPIGKPMRFPMKEKQDGLSCIVVNEECGTILAVYNHKTKKAVENEVIQWNMSTCERRGEPIVVEQGSVLYSAAMSSNGERIATRTKDGTYQRWCASSGDAIGETLLSRSLLEELGWSYLWNKEHCTQKFRWRESKKIIWEHVAPGGAILDKSIVPLSDEVVVCAVDKNNSVAAVGLWTGAFSICEIHL